MSAENETSCLDVNNRKSKIQPAAADRASRIRALNDRLRIEGKGGQVLFTRGLLDQGLDFAKSVLHRIQCFSNFSEANDPNSEHDFRSFDVNGQTVFWKIDYYDRSMTFHSPDSADPSLTCRVLTVMLASEY